MQQKKRLFVLSIDSLADDDMAYARTLPAFGRILDNGACVRHVRAVYPTVTYTVHASIITGVPPMEHGVFNNENPVVGARHNPWFWYQKDLKAPTVLDFAKAAGYSTGAVFYPCMGGGAADYVIPEIWTENPQDDPRPLFATGTTPALMDTVFDKNRPLLNWKYQEGFDAFACACMEDIIRQSAPEVMFCHLSLVDNNRHYYGVQNERIRDAVQKSDAYIGRVLRALEDKNVLADTNFFVISDHGHLPVARIVSPNVYLIEKGLLRLDEQGNVKEWDMFFHSCSLSAQVYVRTEALLDKAYDLLCDMRRDARFGIEQVFTARELRERYQLQGPFQFMVEGAAGTAFRTGWDDALVCEVNPAVTGSALRASHGHLPEKGIQPVLMAFGPDIRRGAALSYASVLDQAPTYAALLGLDMPQCKGRVLRELLRDK